MSDFGKLRRYLKLPSRSASRIRRDIDQELESHIAMRIEALVREGKSPEEARLQAMQKFGDLNDATRYLTTVDEDFERRRRTTGWVSELWQDAAYMLRTLRRTPAFAAATVLTLAVGVGASTAVYGVLHAYLIRPLPFPEPDRLVAVRDGPTLERTNRRGPSLREVDWSSLDSLFTSTAKYDLDGFTILGGSYAETVTGAWVASGFFPTLGLRTALGRGFREDEYRERAPVAIISHELWVRRFGADSGVIGSTVAMHSVEQPNAVPTVTIVGVTPRDFWPVHWRESHVLRPITPDHTWMPSFARLKPGASRIATQGQLNAIVRPQIPGAVDSTWRMSLFPALEQHSAQVRPLIRTIFGAALFMLLAACGGVAGALVSRMSARRDELAIRLALGGSRVRLVRQLLTESAVLAMLAGALGLAIAYALLYMGGPVIEQQLGTRTPGGSDALRPTASIMMLSVLVSTLAGVVLGLVPALTFLRLDRQTAASAVLGAGRSNSARGVGVQVRRVLIAGQVAVAMVLMFGAGLMFRTIAHMQSLELGFRVDGVVKGTVLLPGARYPDSASKRLMMDRILTRVTQTDGVRSAAAVYPYPFGGSWRASVTPEGVAVDEESGPRAMVYTVSPGYFETMDIRLRMGRLFRPTDDHASPQVIIVSEALARRLAPNGDVIGRRIRVRAFYLASFNDTDEIPWRTVIGVVTETAKGFETNPAPDVYVPYAQNPRSLTSIVVRTDRDEMIAIDDARRALSAVDPALAFSDAEPMRAVVVEQGGQRRGLTVLLVVFAAFSLGLSALALYASLSYSVVQRRSELAVRMAVGASGGSILRLIVAEGLGAATVGVVGGAMASLSLGRVLANQLYGVEAGDPATLVSISLVLVLAVIGACVVPGMRAVRTDPVLALRE